MGRATFSATVKVGRSWKNWNTTPTFFPRQAARLSCPMECKGADATKTSPELGLAMYNL